MVLEIRISILLGAVTLLSLVLSGTLADTRLGEGGIERWVAYPIVVWMIAFGGYLLGATSDAPGAAHDEVGPRSTETPE